MSQENESRKREAEEMMLGYTSKFGSLQVMKSEEISEILSKGEDMVLVDVRQEEEREVSMLPTAITKEEFLLLKPQLAKNTRIVPYCTIGHRSGVFGTQLLEEGFQSVFNGEGIVLWSHYESCRLVTGPDKAPTNRVHTFGTQWDKVPHNIEAVQFGYASLIKAVIYSLLGW